MELSQLDKTVYDIFEKNQFYFKNNKGLEFGYTEEEILVTIELLNEDEMEKKIAIVIHSVHFDFEDFVLDYDIDRPESIGEIGPDDMKELYLQGLATVSCWLYEFMYDESVLELCFEYRQKKTIVYSRDLHYYDEISVPLYELQHFLDYIGQHKKRLAWLVKNRVPVLKPGIKF